MPGMLNDKRFVTRPVIQGVEPDQTPEGGYGRKKNRVSRGLAAMGETIRANPERTAYMLGRAASAVMGPFQETVAAQAGRMGSEMAQQGAYTKTVSALLAGKSIREIPEAGILTPELTTQALAIGRETQEMKTREELDRLRIALEEKKVGAEVTEAGARAGYYGAMTEASRTSMLNETFDSITKRMDVEKASTPEERAAFAQLSADTQVRIAEIGAREPSKADSYARIIAAITPEIMQSEDPTGMLKGVLNVVAQQLGDEPVFEVEAITPKTTDGEVEPVWLTATQRENVKKYGQPTAPRPETKKKAITPWVPYVGPGAFEDVPTERGKLMGRIRAGEGSTLENPIEINAAQEDDLPEGTYYVGPYDPSTGKSQVLLKRRGMMDSMLVGMVDLYGGKK